MKLIYTGSRNYDPVSDNADASVCLAESDDLVHFSKKGRVIAWPQDLDLIGFRDPIVWRESGEWRMTIGAGFQDSAIGGAVLLYRSTNLEDWEYVGVMASRNVESRTPIWTGSVWECPQLITFQSGAALTFSRWFERRGYGVISLSGTYTGERFEITDGREFDAGDAFYAAQSFQEPNGRWLMFGWMPGTTPVPMQLEAGWSGAMSVPRVLGLNERGELEQSPAPELEMLRGERLALHDLVLAGTHRLEVTGDALEIRVVFRLGSVSRVGLNVRVSPDGLEQTAIVFDPASRRLSLDRSRSSLNPEVSTEERGLDLDVSDRLELCVFLDASTLEVFAHGRAVSTRIYPTRADSLGLEVFAKDVAGLESLDVWTMHSIW